MTEPDRRQPFQMALEPLVGTLTEMASHGFFKNSDRGEGGADMPPRPPFADSPAMREISLQHQYAGDWDSHPIDTAITHISLLLTAGEDAMLSFAEMVVTDRPPLYLSMAMSKSSLVARKSPRGADPKTVKRKVLAHEAGVLDDERAELARVPKNTDWVRTVVLDLVREANGRGTAKRLLPAARTAGYTGSDRNFRRLVAGVKRLSGPW